MLLKESVEYLLENASTEDLALLRDYMENAKVLREAEEYFNETYFLTEETLVEEFSDGQLAVILEDNGYAVTSENIAALREDIETGAVVIGPEVPDAKAGKDADEKDFDIDNAAVDEHTETETAEDLKAAIVESYLDLMD
jgi:hypothetical protein